MVELNPAATYKLPIKGGYLDIRTSIDPDYPGLDIEFIPDNEDMENDPKTRPRVLIERPAGTDKLRCLVWGDPKSEDYSECIEFA